MRWSGQRNRVGKPMLANRPRANTAIEWLMFLVVLIVPIAFLWMLLMLFNGR